MFVELFSVVVVVWGVSMACGWDGGGGGGFLLRSSNILERFCSFWDWIFVSSRGVNDLKNFSKAFHLKVNTFLHPLIEMTGLA